MSNALSTLWGEIATGQAHGYARDLAAAQGVSEAQLVAAGCGNGVTRLAVNWLDAIPTLETLGEVKVITRNDAIVHEKVGSFGNVSIMQTTGLVLNGGVDLRLFLGHWHHGFQVSTTGPHGPRVSIQVFDLHGNAVLKIHQTKATDRAAWDAFVTANTAADQTPDLNALPPHPNPAPRPDDAIDLDGLRGHWQNLKDVHHFHDMLAQFGVTRLQAMQLAGQPWTREVRVDALSTLLPRLAETQVPFMVFVGNPGCIQIHTGPVTTIREMDGWTNIMDPGFTLHVKNALLSSAWVVRKPSRDGIITTLELYDTKGDNVAILCGQRDPGKLERDEWVALVAALPAADATRAA